MGNFPWAELFFGITRELDNDIIDQFGLDNDIINGNVFIRSISVGDENDTMTIAAVWTPSDIKTGDCDTAFDMPAIDIDEATRAITEAWNAIGLEPDSEHDHPRWHLVASYG